jgi:hypothetical protein
MTLAIRLLPKTLKDGEQLELRVEGLPDQFAGGTAQFVVRGTDDVLTGGVGEIGAQVDADGTATGVFAPHLGRETVLEVTRLRAVKEGESAEWFAPDMVSSDLALLNGAANSSSERIAQRREELFAAQQSRYDAPLGDPNGAGVLEHRVLCVVERLLLTIPMRLSGVSVAPLAQGAGNPALDELRLLHAVLGDLGWATHVKDEWWASTSQSARPWAIMLFPEVWALDLEGAAELAWAERDRLLGMLALNRGASGRALATVVEQRRDAEVGPFRVYSEDERYGGNLVGGFIAGESQHDLLAQDAALRHDQGLLLYLRLFRQALADLSADARFFRLWSILETFSGVELPSGYVVRLLNGRAWPGRQNTTDFAQPRVYELLKRHIQEAAIDEASFVSPAPDLQAAVGGWYARRNATAHYGAFLPGDAVQQGQSWYQRAVSTRAGAQPHDPEPWLGPLQQAVRDALSRKLHSVGGPLV